jgi:ABC-type multidrug transport system fused ATPase/permease subunit
MIWFIYEFSGMMMTPVQLVTAVVQLYLLIGTSFLFGLSLLIICFTVDKRIRDSSYELNFEKGKVSEKKANLVSESFESIRAIKLYGWDGYFHKEILKYMNQEKELEEKQSRIEKFIEALWSFLPALIAPITFIVFLQTGR